MWDKDIMVKISLDGYYLAISTYCRKHGRRGRFLIETQSVRDLLDGNIGTLHDMDCGSHVKIYRFGSDICISFDWLSQYPDDELRGFRQYCEVPSYLLAAVLDVGEPVRYLFQQHHKPAHFDFTDAGSNIRHILSNKIQRRAFIKAMRDNFAWPDTTVSMCPDGIDDFYFITDNGYPKNGGLIYHWGPIKTPTGVRPRYYYAVHT